QRCRAGAVGHPGSRPRRGGNPGRLHPTVHPMEAHLQVRAPRGLGAPGRDPHGCTSRTAREGPSTARAERAKSGRGGIPRRRPRRRDPYASRTPASCDRAVLPRGTSGRRDRAHPGASGGHDPIGSASSEEPPGGSAQRTTGGRWAVTIDERLRSGLGVRRELTDSEIEGKLAVTIQRGRRRRTVRGAGIAVIGGVIALVLLAALPKLLTASNRKEPVRPPSPSIGGHSPSPIGGTA